MRELDEDKYDFINSPKSPEEHLWRSVIERQVLDAMYCHTRNIDTLNFNKRMIRICKPTHTRGIAARAWLFSPTDEDFQTVCDYANLDAAQVREWAQRIIARFDAVVTVYVVNFQIPHTLDAHVISKIECTTANKGIYA